MTSTLPGADIRGFYQALGIQIPGWAREEASVRCFTDPDAHNNDDHTPSVHLNLEHGAWKCHGCGAEGGPYDAAIAKRYTELEAMRLLDRFGIAKLRTRALQTARALLAAGTRPGPSSQLSGTRRVLTVNEHDLDRWQAALQQRQQLLARLRETRGWDYETMRTLELGIDRDHRITIPIRAPHGNLQGLLRYRTRPADQPKMLAAPGSQLALIPNPAAEKSRQILLVEGPPDMIAARSAGATAIAVPGTHAWRSTWATSLARRHIVIVMDCDPEGRAAAQRIASDLAEVAEVDVVDLAPERCDGYDVTDWLIGGVHLHAAASLVRHRTYTSTEGAAS